jgi:hypothetical protein
VPDAWHRGGVNGWPDSGGLIRSGAIHVLMYMMLIRSGAIHVLKKQDIDFFANRILIFWFT